MADSRFFNRSGDFTLRQLAEIASARLSENADPNQVVTDVAPLDQAGSEHVSFLDNTRYLEALRQTKAGACLIAPKHADKAPEGTALLLCEDPYLAYAKIATAFYPERKAQAGRHATAVVDPTASLGEGVALGPYVVIGAAVKIGANCRLGAHAVVEDGVEIGSGTEVGPGASLSHCLVGKDCQIHAGARIGNRGFGFAITPQGFTDVPQLGRVLIGDRVEIGANVTIDRGAGPDTVVGSGSKIDNLVQIGHNVQIGEHCVLVAQSGVAGSTKLEDQVMLAAQAGIAGHLTLARGSRVGAKSGVMRDVPAGETVVGLPALPGKDYFRLVALWQRQLKAQGKKK